jgi:hypothetical protein
MFTLKISRGEVFSRLGKQTRNFKVGVLPEAYSD